MKKLFALLLFAAPCFAQTAPPPLPVNTFSVTTSVASLPVLGNTVAANISGASLEVNKGIGIQQVDVLASGVQVYLAGLHYTANLDKLTPATWKSAGWHFKFTPYANMGVVESSSQHIAVLAGGDFSAQPPGSSKFSLVTGGAYINAAGITGHAIVKLGPMISF